MSTKLEAAARQALERIADPRNTHFAGDAQVVAREALAEQAAEPNAVLVEGFGRVAMRKLNDLHEKGYAINGVSIATINEAGETELGAVTTGGRVLWWPQQPAQQAAEPVTDDAKDAERYRWLKSRMMGADFDWNESGACALVFEWPRDVPVGANCDRNIDRAIEAAHGITSKEGGAA